MARYKTYHGRSQRRGVKIALLVLLAAGLASFFIFVLPNYISFDSDGNISIDLPFLKNVIVPPSPSPSDAGVSIVIESPSFADPSGVSPDPTDDPPSPTPSIPNTAEKKMLFIPSAKTKSVPGMTDLREKALAEGYSGIVIEYKGEGAEGETDLAMTPETARSVMEVFSGSGLELTALISACVDNEKPRMGTYTAWAVKHQSGQNFWDKNKNRWLNLYKQETGTLIIGLCRQAIEDGFDRVLLSNIGFPYLGALNTIRYDNENDQTHTRAVNAFLTRLHDEMGTVALDAVLFPETARDGAEETAGQEAEAFRQTFDRLYVFDGEIAIPSEYIPILQKTDPALESKIEAAEYGYVLYEENGIY